MGGRADAVDRLDRVGQRSAVGQSPVEFDGEADADRRLYLAKNAGRDRIVWAG